MSLSESEYQAMLSRPAIARVNPSGDSGVRPVEPQPVEGHALERVAPREVESGSYPPERPKVRRRITYIVYAVRPCDFDGYHIKELQDLLVTAGVLAGDEWDILQGEIISRKVRKKKDERTEVFIEPWKPFTYNGKTIIADELI